MILFSFIYLFFQEICIEYFLWARPWVWNEHNRHGPYIHGAYSLMGKDKHEIGKQLNTQNYVC